MQYKRSVPRLLHDEHLDTLAMLDGVDRSICARREMPRAGDIDIAATLRAVRAALSNDVPNHFAFEEDVLFPYLTERGEGDIAALLKEEHDTMSAVSRDLLVIFNNHPDFLFTDESWSKLRQLASEWVERMTGHVQKEEMALLPVLEDTLDEESDAALIARYL